MNMPGSMPVPPPNQVVLGDPTAVMGRRIGAYVIDVIIGWIIFGLLVVAMGDTLETRSNVCDASNSPAICFDVGDTVYFADDDTGGGIFLLTIGYWFFIGVVVQGATGATPGKLMVGLRVVDKHSGRPAGFGKAGARTLLWIVDAMPVIPLVGLITASTTKGHRRVGDMVAGTLVVDKAGVGRPPVVVGLTVAQGPYGVPAQAGGYAPPPGAYAPPTAPPVSPSPPTQPPPGGPVTPPGGVTAPPPAPHPDPFAPPEAPVADTVPATSATPVSPSGGDGVDAPKWDADRGAYIQWDKVHQLWMVYDDAAGKWKPLV